MSKFNEFISSNKNNDLEKYEKMYGSYGCKYCKDDVDFAYWVRDEQKIIWVCSQNHRSEMQFD
jgi:hypothetical protein